MAKVQYKGPSHFRVLDASDMKKFGVEGFKKTVFEKGEAVEVDDSVAKVLVETLGEFELAKEKKAEVAPETATPTAPVKSGGDAPANKRA